MNDELHFETFTFFAFGKLQQHEKATALCTMKSERKTCRKLWNIACTIHQYHASLTNVRMDEESLNFSDISKFKLYGYVPTLENIAERTCLLANILEFFKPLLYFTVQRAHMVLFANPNPSDQPLTLLFYL